MCCTCPLHVFVSFPPQQLSVRCWGFMCITVPDVHTITFWPPVMRYLFALRAHLPVIRCRLLPHGTWPCAASDVV